MRLIDIAEDDRRSAGFARIRVARALVEPVRLTIRREGGDAQFLGPHGWQADRALLEPVETAVADGTTILTVGPDIVDPIEESERVVIAFPDAGIETALFWPDIAKSGLTARQSGIGAARMPATGPVARQQAPLRAAPASAALDALEPEPPATRAGHPQRRLMMVAGAAALLILVAAGLAAWLLLRPGGEERAATAAPAPAAADLDPKARLRRLVQGGSAGELGAFAREMLGAGQGEVGYTATDIAAQRGDAGSLLQMGRWYDPRHFEASGRHFSRPSAEQAARYYREAAAAGAMGAGEELDGLCRALREAPSDDADERAAREAQGVLGQSCPP